MIGNSDSESLQCFMDVAQRAVIDLDSRVAGAVKFARSQGTELHALWHPGFAFLREDPVVTEIVLHYLRDRRAQELFHLGWEPHYEGATVRADLSLRCRGSEQLHLIEAKWWWWSKDRGLIISDKEKLEKVSKGTRGHLLVFTTGNTPTAWRDPTGAPSSSAVAGWFRQNASALWSRDVGDPIIRTFETAVNRNGEHAANFVGALLLLPVV